MQNKKSLHVMIVLQGYIKNNAEGNCVKNPLLQLMTDAISNQTVREAFVKYLQ